MDAVAMLILRDYQNKIITDVRGGFRRQHQRQIMQMSTGAGKTAAATKLAEMSIAKGTRVLFVAHRKELVQQLSGALTMWGVPHGVIAPWAKETNRLVQVAMVGTLAKRVRLDRNGRYRFKLVVIDECHHLTQGSQWGQVLEHNSDAWCLGLTATPARLDGKPLGRNSGGYFDDIVHGPSTLWLIEQGYLCPPVFYPPPKGEGPDLSGIKKRRGDWDQKQLAAVTEKSVRVGDYIKEYRDKANYVPGIAFCLNVADAENTCLRFQAAGYQAAVLTGKTPDRQREQMISDLANQRLHVLTSVNTISEGTDIPVCGVGIFLRPTASLTLYFQMVGRVLRAYPGKDKAIILDHVGNYWNHPNPLDEIEWSLDGKPKKPRDEKPVKQCPNCFAIQVASARRCTECGHEFSPEQTDREGPETVDGELQAVDAVAEARKKRREVAQARTLEDLEAIGRARGYKRGWAKIMWEKRRQMEMQYSEYPEFRRAGQ